MQVLFLALIIAQPPVAKVPPKVVMPPMVREVEKIRPVQYPYVLFVGQSPVKVGNYQSIRDDKAYDRSGVYFVMSDRSYRIIADDVLGECRRLEGDRMAIPFDLSFSRKIALREVLVDGKASWPTMGRLSGMERYKPAKLTQSIFKYTGNPNGIIRGVPRSETEPKYQVPGGLVGVKGWRSELYRYVPDEPRQFHVMFPVRNSVGYIQHEAAFQRQYPDETEFDDVLVNESSGRVFEHRVSQKLNGRWERFVAFKDASERPTGYQPLKSGECQGCHNHSDRTYGNGLPSGGDEIFSDPFRDFPGHGEERQVVLR
jgi:hypothetical protein